MTVETLAFDFTNIDYSPVKDFLAKFQEIGLLGNANCLAAQP